MSFFDWMLQYKGKKTPRGILADEMIRLEGSFPKDGTYEDILTFLEMQELCDVSIQIFMGAWQSYEHTKTP